MLRILQMEVEELFSVLEPARDIHPVLKISGAVEQHNIQEREN